MRQKHRQINIHCVQDSSFKRYKECVHDDLDERAWYMEEDSKCYKSLVKELEDPVFHENLSKCSPHFATSSLESFHNVVMAYAPKHYYL
jgi:hypothetical protein